MSDMPAAERRAEDLCRALRAILPDTARSACGLVRDAQAELYPSEHAAIERAVRTRRNEFASGRKLARLALAKIGVTPGAIPVDGNRRPVWPAGVTGSLSHAAGLCGVVVSRTRDIAAVGLDIERIADVSPDLLPTIALPEEIEALSGTLPGETLPAVLFSAREAVYKAYNPHADRYLGHRDVRLTIEGDRFCARILAPDVPLFFGCDRVDGAFACVNGMVVSVVVRPA